MNSRDVRLRFAPSPTGYLHVGGARTALYNWLYARKTGGKFLLRVEDTDRERSSEAHTKVILDGLTWLGLNWDEEVVFQGARVQRHQEVADNLVASGHAYLEDGAVRFRMPRGEIAWEDFVHGRISFQGSDIKDWVILRSDRTPTYNLGVVVDDIDMQISHVMRGDDHISNTPKQIPVYQAMAAALPSFGHVPMIHGMDGKKLSKRHGATAVGDYEGMGILPAAMRNFLALLGWSPGDDRELFFDVTEMIDAFSLDKLQAKSAIFDVKKLEWMNGQYISRTAPETMLPLISSSLAEKGIAASERERVLKSIEVVRERARTTLELAERVAIRVSNALPQPDEKTEKAIAKNPDEYRQALDAVTDLLNGIPESRWNPYELDASLRALAESRGVEPGKVFQPIRMAVTGATVSEAVHVLLTLVGRDETLRRIASARAWGRVGAG